MVDLVYKNLLAKAVECVDLAINGDVQSSIGGNIGTSFVQGKTLLLVFHQP